MVIKVKPKAMFTKNCEIRNHNAHHNLEVTLLFISHRKELSRCFMEACITEYYLSSWKHSLKEATA